MTNTAHILEDHWPKRLSKEKRPTPTRYFRLLGVPFQTMIFIKTQDPISISSIEELLKRISGLVISFGICAYIIGFVVVGTHLNRLNLIDLNVLQPRYLAAGSLYLFFSAGVYASLGYCLSTLLSSFPEDKDRALSYFGFILILSIFPLYVITAYVFKFPKHHFGFTDLPWLLSAILLALLQRPLYKYPFWKKLVDREIICWAILITSLMTIEAITTDGIYVFFYCFVSGALFIFSQGHLKGTDAFANIRERIANVFAGIIFILLSIFVFGWTDYPKIKSYLGGGEERNATVVMNANYNTKIDELLDAKGPLKVITIAHETAEAIYTCKCPKERTTIMIPKSDIAAIQFSPPQNQ